MDAQDTDSVHLLQLEWAWSHVAKVLALVARHDPRAAVADAAAAALVEILGEHHAKWDAQQWGAFWASGLAYVLTLPQQPIVPATPPPVTSSASSHLPS